MSLIEPDRLNEVLNFAQKASAILNIARSGLEVGHVPGKEPVHPDHHQFPHIFGCHRGEGDWQVFRVRFRSKDDLQWTAAINAELIATLLVRLEDYLPLRCWPCRMQVIEVSTAATVPVDGEQ